MKRNIYKITALCLLAIVTGVTVYNSPASAATTTGSQALEIAPPVITFSADPGQTKTVQISLRNVSSGSVVVTAQANDFVAAGEDGTPKILLDDSTPNPYSLKDWIGPVASLTLTARQLKSLPVTITIPANASPGGHYGVVRFTATPPELKGTGVSLAASLGALILVNVNGKINDNLSVAQFSTEPVDGMSWLYESAPIKFIERLKNNGNTHEQPSGQITISDMYGKKIANVNVNLPPRIILPSSTREFSQALDSQVIGNKFLFGRYTADLKLTYGANKQVITSSLTFWVIPYKLIALAIIVLVGGFFGLRFAIRRYNNHIISKAQNQGSKPKHKSQK